MRLLFVAPYAPSPIRVRTYQILRHLAKAGHRITLAALDDGSADDGVKAELAGLCEAVRWTPLPKRAAALRCLAALPTPTPLWVAYCRSPELRRVVGELAAGGGFDAAHVEHLRAAFVREALGDLPSVIDAVDCITDLQDQLRRTPGSLPGRLLAAEEWFKLRRWEPRAYAAYDRIAVTGEWDAAALRALDPSLPPIAVLPNGVDLEYFAPPARPSAEPDTLVFSGKMSYRANEDAAWFLLKEVLPSLRRRRPGVRLILAGSDPSAALRAQAASLDGVEVTGRVEDLRPSLTRASVAVCPMRIGVGIQNKALEAMALGLPVVCTARVARPIQAAVDAGAAIVADSIEEIVGACERLLADPQEAGRRGACARMYVEERHRWCQAATGFEELYEQASRQTRRPGVSRRP